MNDSIWWDGLEGETLACRPGLPSDDAFVLPCLLIIRIIPMAMLIPSTGMLYVAWVLHRQARRSGTTAAVTNSTTAPPPSKRAVTRHASSVARGQRPLRATRSTFRGQMHSQRRHKTTIITLVNQMRGVQVHNMNHHAITNMRGASTVVVIQKKPRRKSPFKGSYAANMVTSIALAYVTGNLAMLVHGHGTMYSSDTFRGLLGDGIYTMYFGVTIYVSLLQVRGARWLKRLVESRGHRKAAQRKTKSLPPVTYALDMIQGRFQPAIGFSMWLLLAAGVLPRAWFYSIGQLLTSAFGSRAVTALATQRLSALRKVATMHRVSKASDAVHKRRKAALKAKKRVLAIDLAGVTLISAILPAFSVALGSTFSSRQMAIHLAILSSIATVGGWIFAISMYVDMKKAVKEQQKRRASGAARFTSRRGQNRSAHNKSLVRSGSRNSARSLHFG